MAVGTRLCVGGPYDGRKVDHNIGSSWPWVLDTGYDGIDGVHYIIIGWYVWDGGSYHWHSGEGRPDGT